MKKTAKLVLSLATVATVLTTGAALASPQVAPFTDNLEVNAISFPQGGAYLTYQSDTANRVNIDGPGEVKADNSTFMVHVSSNYWSNGYPSMQVTFPTTGETCRLLFVDGALVNALDFKNGAPPTDCGHLKVGYVTPDAQYKYHINLIYDASR